MTLWLCLRFHLLPLKCLERTEERAVVVLEKQRVLRVNDCAAAAGVREGMKPATVRALLGEEPLQLLERDTAAEERCLQQLCCWAYSISPSLHSWQSDCLQLEIGSCLALYRGLPPLLDEVRSGLAARGFNACFALGPTPKAAWLLSFAEDEQALAIEQPLELRLAALPLTLLQAHTGPVDSLRRAGLHTLGDILALPQAAIGRRCGKTFIHFLRQVLGQQEDIHPDYQPPSNFSDEYWFGYEVKANDELQPAIQLLLQSLCKFLRNTQLQTAEIVWQLIGIDHSLRKMRVRSTSSHSDWQSWFSLTRIHLDRLELATGVEGIALECVELRGGQLENIDLFNPRKQKEPLASLLDRLRSRLGLQAVEQVGCRDEHLPEHALHTCSERPAGGSANSLQRPFWLMAQPQQLSCRRNHLHWQGELDLVYGPERIEDNWWQQPVSRDYYIARGDQGQHYWVFRDRLEQAWYMHGIFA
ncbi:DNA polymerase Y family protein [Halioglobus maricola]|uniref:DNA polymerase Y family protein n=1 Tax=Halioglobus maricola TaxID=2601894 RepID=A0A5P9NMR4_9GAMM|nr:DNA polymerase Y family protein [Halioglobus maricola]QFU77042.1 DNA polymerase Y family protein [Halioglobus maricola]